MKRWAMWRTPAAAAAPRAVRPARELAILIARSSDGGRSPDLLEEAGQVAGQVVEVAAGRRDVHEAEQRGLELASCELISMALASSALSGWRAREGNAAARSPPIWRMSVSSGVTPHSLNPAASRAE